MLTRTRRAALHTAAAALATLALAACAQRAAQPALAGSEWQLRELRGIAPPAGGAPITLSFGADGRVGGSSGCNSYGGSYRADGPQLTISELASTKMACLEQGVMEREASYLEALSAVARYQADAAQLTLSDAGGVALLRLSRR